MTAAECARAAVEAVVVDATSYVWLGQRVDISPAADGEERWSALRTALSERLYADFYTAGGAAPIDSFLSEPARGPWPDRSVDALSEANSGRGSPQPGWVVRGREGDRVIIERDGLRAWAKITELDGAGAPIEPGREVVAIRPKESLGLPQGFYVAYGDAGDGVEVDPERVDRFYWSVRPEGRTHLVGRLTTALNARGLPFRLKVLNAASFPRADAAVLYTPRGDRSRVATEIAGVLVGLSEHLRATTPAFTRPLARGVAFAEDPPGEDSFGEHRCGLVAEALIDARRLGSGRTADRLAAVARRFTCAGLSSDAPHLNPGSHPADDPVLPEA